MGQVYVAVKWTDAEGFVASWAGQSRTEATIIVNVTITVRSICELIGNIVGQFV